jgi:hypothetical protein
VSVGGFGRSIDDFWGFVPLCSPQGRGKQDVKFQSVSDLRLIRTKQRVLQADECVFFAWRHLECLSSDCSCEGVLMWFWDGGVDEVDFVVGLDFWKHEFSHRTPVRVGTS